MLHASIPLLSHCLRRLVLILMLGVLGGGAEPAALRETAAPKNEPEASATEEPLPAGAVARLGTLRFRHSSPVTHIGIGPDGTSILSAAGHIVYVWDLATGKERRRFLHKTPRFEKTPVVSFACSRNGKLLGAGCEDGTIHVWDLATGQRNHRFTAHDHQKPSQPGRAGALILGFSSDDRYITSVGGDGSLQLWDVESGEKNHEFAIFRSLSLGSKAELSPDGKTLACVVKEGKNWELRLWEVATGRELKRRPQQGKAILSPAFSPDGKWLAIAVGEEDWQKPCDIQLWDASAEKTIRTLRGHKSWAWCVFAPDSKTLASWSIGEGTALLWDVNTGKEISRIGAGSKVNLNQLVFCPDGRTLASFTQGHHHLQFWDRASGKEVRSSEDAITPIDYLSFSPDGRLLAAGSGGHWVIRLWDVAARKTVRRIDHGLLSALQFSPDGSRLASAAWTGTDSRVRIWGMAGGKEVRRIPSSKSDKRIGRMAWSGDGKVLATVAWSQNDSRIHLWNPETGKQLRELNAGVNRGIDSLVLSPNSKILAVLRMKKLGTIGHDHILLWEEDTGRLLHTLELPTNPPYLNSSDPTRLAFSPDGRTLAAGGQRADASIYVWELASGRLRSTLKHGEDVACLAFSPDGKLLAAVNNYNAYRNYGLKPESLAIRIPFPYVHIWDLAAGKEIHVLEGQHGPISTLAFSPDGKLLATGSYDTTILLWDATHFKTNRPAQMQLRPEQVESLWADLSGGDAIKAYHAIRTLAAAPKTSVAFLKRHLKPVAPADARQVARLIDELDSEQFAVREKAMQRLEKIGESAATELHKALAGKPSLEVRRRIEQLLEKHNDAERIRMVRALETLETIGTTEARDFCAKLAEGVADAPLTREARATLRRMTR